MTSKPIHPLLTFQLLCKQINKSPLSHLLNNNNNNNNNNHHSRVSLNFNLVLYGRRLSYLGIQSRSIFIGHPILSHRDARDRILKLFGLSGHHESLPSENSRSYIHNSTRLGSGSWCVILLTRIRLVTISFWMVHPRYPTLRTVQVYRKTKVHLRYCIGPVL